MKWRLCSQMLSAFGVQPDAATSFAPNSLDALSELLWLSDISLQKAIHIYIVMCISLTTLGDPCSSGIYSLLA